MRKKMALCSIVVLLSCVVSAYSASAPGDANSFCTTPFPGSPDPPPSFPGNVRVLLDSYNYINLLPPHDGPVWQTVDNDQNNEAGRGTSWTQNTNIFCRQRINVCGFTVGPQNNWAITQYITRPDPDLTQVSVLVEFELLGCLDRSCEKAFVLSKYETPMLTPAEARDTSRFSFVSRVATADGTGLTRQNRTTELDFSTNNTGFYLAIVDESTCIGIFRVIVFYHVCPGVVEDFVIRPETLAPRIQRISSPFAVSAQCVDEASPENGLSARLLCNQGGEWTQVLGSGCHCDPGLVPSEDGRSCIASTATGVTSPLTSAPSPTTSAPGEGSGSGAGLEIEFEQSRYEVAEDIGRDNLALRVCLRIRSSNSFQTVTVVAFSGTALSDVDFSFKREELQLNPGNFLRCVAVVIYEDQLFEDDESFFLRIVETGGIARVTILDGDATSFNFTGNTPSIRGDTVLFRLSLGPRVERALCAILHGSDVLDETDCSGGFAFFSNIYRRFVELTPRVTLFRRNDDDDDAPVVIADTARNFRLTAGARRRCSVHLINSGITTTHSDAGAAVTTVEWGVATPVGVAPSDLTFTCSLDGGSQFPCNSPFTLETSARSLSVQPPRRAQGCIRGIPRTFSIY